MRCQYLYDCDPGDMYAHQCESKANTTILLSYRNGSIKEKISVCDAHIKSVLHINLWGKKYGHNAKILEV